MARCRALLINAYSWENGLLSSLGIGQLCDHAHWRWLDDHPDGRSDGRSMGHVPICRRIRSRLRHANGKIALFVLALIPEEAFD